MAAPVNATINVLANTDQAVAQFRSLQAQVASLNKTVSATSGAAVAQQAALNRALMDGANASRMWNARVVPMNTAVNQFGEALDKGRMSLGQYTRYAASQLPGMSRVFRREFDMMNRVATENVRQMQTQYMALGRSATGAAQAMAFTPTALNQQAAATQIAAQRQMMMNRMIDLGTTKLLNWGKNTQWAGRQLMVGFSIPLAMMGAAAAKAFKEIDQSAISFRRVYGDLQTTTAEMERNLEAVKALGMEYTKYGNSLAETIELGAAVAATGQRNNDLTAATEQTLRLATLGLMENAEAMEAVIALQTAFQISSDDLAQTIDFLNVVENETILTMQDMAAAIPRVAPVIKGLGGDVKDLAVFMTALREGGVTAEQGANALKSGLGRLINPTKAAREEMAKYGISIDQIVQKNRGDLMGTVKEFGDALSSLGQLEQQQVLQKVFGTYQYARLGALFRNLSNDAGQAQRTMELTSMSVEDLARISERELGKIEEATSVKFQAAVEQLKVAIAPIGETFMKALTPVLDFISKLLNSFNDLPDNVKNIIAIVIGAIAGIGPIVLMTVGLIANGIANIGKLIQTMRKFFARLKGDARLFDYLTKEEREAAAAANSLSGATDNLTGRFVGQQKALERLIQLVNQYARSLASTAAAAPIGMGMGSAAMAATAMGAARTSAGSVISGPRTGGTAVFGSGGMRMAKGGVVPGVGNKDTVPAMLTPGESVVTKQATQKYGPMIQAMNAGTIPGFVSGVVNIGSGTAMRSVSMQVASYKSTQAMQRQVDRIIAELVEDGVQMDKAIDRVTSALTRYGQTMEAAGKKASAKTLSGAMQQEGLTRTSRSLVAAHMTAAMPYSDPRTQAAIAQQSAAFQAFARANPDYVRATSKLTATLPALLNQQLARSGATFGQFRQGWRMGGKDKFLNAAVMTDDTIRGDAEAGKALRKMAGDVGRRAIQVAKAAGSQKVKDEHLAVATQQVIDKYKVLGGASTKAATALERAASQVGQLRVNVPARAVKEGLASGTYVQQGRSIVTRSGVEVARDMGARAAGNIPIAGGLATATARQQSEILAKVMAANGPIVAASYFATNTPAMVSGTAAMAKQASQTFNKTVEANTQDIAVLARDRNSPHPTVKADATSDARAYATQVKQTILSMIPVKVPGGLVQAAPPRLPQGTQFRAPGGGVAQVYNPSNNPLGLGVTGEARAVRGAVAAIESRTAVLNRLRAQEEAQAAEQSKFRVVDKRRTGAVTRSAVLLEEENSFLARANQAAQRLAQQRALNETALKAEQEAQQRLTGAKQRAAILQESMNQRPARGGILDRPLGALRRFAFPGGQDASLKNLGFNQFSGQMKTAGQLIVESAQNIKTRVAANLKTLPADFKAATTQLLINAKSAGTALKTDFKNLGGTIKTNMQVDLKTLTTPIIGAATAIKNLGTSAASAAQRMAGGVGNFMTAVDKNGTPRMQKVGQAGNAAVMGLMGVSMAASFMQGSVGEMAQKIMPVTMGLMGLQMILPMFTNPLGLAIIAITALVGSFIWMRKTVDDAAKSAAKMAAEQGAAANRMETIAEALDYEFASERVGERRFTFSLDEEAQTAIQEYFQTEGGSKFIEDLKAATSEERFAKLSSQLAFAIADGLSPEKGREFGLAVAKELDDSFLAARLQAAFVRGEFKSGSGAMIDLVEQRQEAVLGAATGVPSADWREGLTTTERLVDASLTPVTSAVHGLSRPLADLAGTANTTTDVLGKAALTVGTFAGVTAAAGAPIAGVGAVVGGILGTLAGLAVAIPQAVTDMAALEENSRAVAASFSSTIQVLKEVDNAEALLLEERRKGIITAEEYAEKEAKLNEIKNRQATFLSDAITKLVDQGASEQAIVDQLVLGGFDEATAGAVARATNREQISAQVFQGKAYEDLSAEQQNFVNKVIADIFSGLTPENAAQKIADIERIYKQVASGLSEATLGSMELSGLQDLAETERISQAVGILYEGQPRFSDIVAANFASVDDAIKDLGLTSTDVFNRIASFADKDLITSVLGDPDKIRATAEAISELQDFEGINIESVVDLGLDPIELADALERMSSIKVDDEVAGILLNPEVYANIGMSLGQSTEEIESSYTQMANTIGQAFITAKQNTKDLNGEIKGIDDQLLLTSSGEFVINTKLITTMFGEDIENPGEIASILNSAFPEGLDPVRLQIAVQALLDPISRAIIAANPQAFKAAMAGETSYKVSNLGPEERRYGVKETFRTQTFADLGEDGEFFSQLSAGSRLATEFARGQQDFEELDKGGGGGGGSAEKSFLEQTMEDLQANAMLYLTTGRAAKKYGKTKADFFGIFQELRTRFGVPEGFIASLGTGVEAVQKAIEFMEATKAERKKLIALYKETTVGQQIERLRRDREARKARTDAIAILAANGISLEDAKRVAEDSELATAIVEAAAKGNKKKLNALLDLIKTEVIPEEEEPEDPLDALSDRLSDITDLMGQAFDAAEIEAADKVAAKFFTDNNKLAEGLAKSTGHTIQNGYQLVEAMERQVALNERLIDQEQDRIDKKQEEINDYERTNSLIQQGIDNLRRNDELRNRRSESLSRDLEQISQAEEKIRKQYQDRINALDKVAKVNDHLIQQQQKQLNLSRAISEGDIYAATQAAQEMRAASAQQAVEQTRLGLERGMEAEIESLTSAEGKTRAQIEEEIANIKEQNYQNSLLIRIEEDKIYANSLEIRRLSNEIYDIQENIIEPLQNQNKEYSRMLDYYKDDADYQISRVTLAGMTREQFEKQANALATSIKNARDLSPELQAIVGDYNAIAAAARNAVNEARGLGVNMSSFPSFGQAPPVSTTDFSGLTPDMFGGMDFSNLNLDFSGINLGGMFGFNSGGMVLGEGSRDSISAMLTPGEYVIRKAMVDKYGIPLMEALNQGSFAMPTYDTGPEVPEIGAVNMNNISNVNAPVYNTYDMKFSISGTNQSADEIANKVMFKMKQLQSQGVRSNRGY